MNVGCAIIFGFIALAVLLYFIGSSSGTSSSSSSSSSSAAAVDKSTPKLELTAFHWSRESDSYVIGRGQVKNISGESLKNIQAVVTYSDKSGSFITSDDALITYNPILPGQTSPFEVITTRNPAMATARVDFKEIFGGAVPTRDATK